MPWRQSSGRDRCHDCKKTVDLGAAVFVGERTPATWCELCAEATLGQTLGDAHEVPQFLRVDTALQGMRELVEKFKPKVRPTWGERE